MVEKKYIGAIDQGTTSTRFVIFDKKGIIKSISQIEHKQIFPNPGWVEHDPVEIRDNTFKVIKSTLNNSHIKKEELAAVGITNQRETTILWNKKTGKPYYNAIVWQDTRTDNICKEITGNNNLYCFQKKTGLPVATYFSGPKIRWILDNVDGVKDECKQGNVLFGTIDSFITWWLTGGPDKGVHVTDVTNASRTLLMNIESLNWDKSMLDVLDIPENILPEIKSCSEVYGYTKNIENFEGIPVAGILGDQQAALFGQICFNKGEAKNTYGTGCFLLLNTGNDMILSRSGLITTPAYKIGESEAVYALEGSIAIAGSLVQWLRDNLGLIEKSSDIEKLANTVKDNGGLFFVPAFSGLFAPYWRSDARGVITGITHFANKGHFARAVLEATAFQAKEVLNAMKIDSGVEFNLLKVDGGMVVNELLMQFQADILDIPVIRPEVIETTVLGAAYAAGLAVGFWNDIEELKTNWAADKKWESRINNEERDKLFSGWQRAVERSFDLK